MNSHSARRLLTRFQREPNVGNALRGRGTTRPEAERGSRSFGDRPRPVLIHALDGFLGAGSASRLAAEELSTGGPVVHEFDLDSMFDYRARRPMVTFESDHYRDYQTPQLRITRETDAAGHDFYLLSGAEPDFRWEAFVDEAADVIEALDVSLVLGLAAVPMGVPHTRPAMITAHGSSPDLVDRQNLWQAEVVVPASAQALLELRLSERGSDAIGYVVHVPHYLAQIEYPDAALALIEALSDRTGLIFDTHDLQQRQESIRAQIEQQITDQDGGEVLHGLEEQYDAFARGAAESLLAHDEELPSGDELAAQFAQFLARQRKDNSD